MDPSTENLGDLQEHPVVTGADRGLKATNMGEGEALQLGENQREITK